MRGDEVLLPPAASLSPMHFPAECRGRPGESGATSAELHDPGPLFYSIPTGLTRETSAEKQLRIHGFTGFMTNAIQPSTSFQASTMSQPVSCFTQTHMSE